MAISAVDEVRGLLRELLNFEDHGLAEMISKIANGNLLGTLLGPSPHRTPPIKAIKPQYSVNLRSNLCGFSVKERIQFIAALGWYCRSQKRLHTNEMIDFLMPYQDTMSGLSYKQAEILKGLSDFSSIVADLPPFNEVQINELKVDEVKTLLESAQRIHYYALRCFERPIPHLPNQPNYTMVKAWVPNRVPESEGGYYTNPDFFELGNYPVQSFHYKDTYQINNVIEQHFAIPSFRPDSATTSQDNANQYENCKTLLKIFADAPLSEDSNSILTNTKKLITFAYWILAKRRDINDDVRNRLQELSHGFEPI